MNIGVVTTSVHAGTHADAPLHVESSWGDSATLKPDAFVGDACVIALPSSADSSAEISIHTLRAMIGAATGIDSSRAESAGSAAGTERGATAVPARLLCRTGCSVADGVFPEAWPTLSEPAAAWLVSQGVVLWGTDAPSVDTRASKLLPVHHRLFAGGAYVLENLSLAHVAPGMYELLAQPISIAGADAAPVRAMLRAMSREWLPAHV